MKIKSLVIVLLVVIAMIVCVVLVLNRNPKVEDKLNIAEIMEMIKTDKDYNDLLSFVNGFDPEVVDYVKIGPKEYKKLKTDWQNQGLAERVKSVDQISLTNFTYWVELKNKNDTTKGLITILDTKEKKSLLLIATLAVEANLGI